MACYNRNTQEYKNLLNTFANNIQVDSIIVSWQKINKSDKLPSVNEAKQLLKNKKTLFNLKTKDFSETLLSNLSNKNLISKYKDVYYVNNSDKLNKVYDATVLQSNVNKIKRYLAINNIPIDAVQFTPTRKSIKITVNESLFTPKDLLESSRSWNKEKSRHVIAHLMKLFPTIQVDLVSVFEAKKYYDNLPEWQKSNVSFNKVKSYFDPVNNTVKLIKGRVTDETAIEEMLHPFTDALFVDNKALFDSLLTEAKIMFPVLNQQIKDSYSNKFGFNQTYRDLELVTQALTRHFKKEYEKNPTKTFKERVKEFLEWFAGIINNLHKYITGNDIPFFKRDISYYQGDQALMEQEEGFEQVKSTEVKPGVAELFESNPELANSVYEALGFKTKTSENEITRGIKEVLPYKAIGDYSNIEEGLIGRKQYETKIGDDTYVFEISNYNYENEDGTYQSYYDIDFTVNGSEELVGTGFFDKSEKGKQIIQAIISQNFGNDTIRFNVQESKKGKQRLLLYKRLMSQLGYNPSDEMEYALFYNANIYLSSSDRIIFGHPTIGKSFLKRQGENKFITLDDDYANEVNAFVDANRGSETRQEYKGRKPREYNEFMLNLYDRLKVQAKKEGKILFVSNTNILKERMSDFDRVITMPKDEFKKRFDARGATYGFEDWKSDIDATVAKVPSNKVISTTGYLSDLFESSRKINLTPQQKQQALQLYSQYLEETGKQDIEGFKKFVSQPSTSVKEGVEELFESNPELANSVYETLGIRDYNGITVELGRSEVRKIGKVQNIIVKYNGKTITGENKESGLGEMNIVIQSKDAFVGMIRIPLDFQGKGLAKYIYQATADLLNTPIINSKERGHDQTESGGYVWKNRTSFQPNQITPQQKQQAQQLYSQYLEETGKQDIEGFKEFVTENQASAEVTTINLQDIKPTATLSDIAKLLNTSDIRFDATARADAKIRFSLTPELQSTVDYALRQSNDIQKVVIKKLFHQAQEVKEEVGSLSAGEGGPIVILNEENHVYYNLLDTTETFKSTTERIKGKLSEEDLFNKKLNIDLGNDFDKLLQGLTADKTLDEVFSQMKILNREQAEKAYLQLQENLSEITQNGGVAIPQVVVYDEKSKTAGSIDILVVLPNGKLRIIDLKTSKNSVKNKSYNTKYKLNDDSDLKKVVDGLSTKSQQAIQVNVYRRMLENMGYEVDMSDIGASTFHIQVGIEGKDAEQKFTGKFEFDNWVGHKITDSKIYVDLLVPSNVNVISSEEYEKLTDDFFDTPVDFNKFTNEEKMPDKTSNSYVEYEVIMQALETFQLGLITKQKALEEITSSIYMNRTKEETQENIANALSLINIAMQEGPVIRSRIFTEFLENSFKEIKSFTNYVTNPNNFDKPEYITYVLNYTRFIKTYEGLYSVKNLDGVNETQKEWILKLQTELNKLGNNTLNQTSLIDQAIENYVKNAIKKWSSRDDLTEDVLNDIIKHAKDISSMEYNTGDLATSGDTILAIMDKIYKTQKQKVLDIVESRNNNIAELAAKLQKLSLNKNTQEMYHYMLEFDKDGNFNGKYVERLGKQYFEKLETLRNKLYDDNGNQIQYRDIDDVSTASKEDLEYNINLAKAKADYANFWSAERVGLDDKLFDGDFHKYTDEFKTERNKFQYYIPINGKAIWRRKAGVSDKAYQVFLSKYYNQIEYTQAIKDQNGNFTGAIKKDNIFNAVKPKYRVANDYNLRTGERLINDKYEKIMNPTDALGQAQKDFYLAFVNYYDEFLKKIPPGKRAQMLGKAPIIKGKLFQDIKNKSNIIGKLWAKTTRSIDNLISETAEQRGVVLDENGNLVDQLPIFYTGRPRTDAELSSINNEIDLLNEKLKKGLIIKVKYDSEMAILKGKRASIQARPSTEELNMDMGVALQKFSAMAEHFEVMSSVEDTFKAFIKVLEKREYQPMDSLVTLGTWQKGQFKPKGRKSGIESNIVRRAKKWMSMVFYDNDQITKGFLEKISDGLITYSSLSYVAFNPFGNFNNYALGRINNSIEAIGQRFYSTKSYARSEFEFNKRAIPDLLYRLSSASKKINGKSDYDPKLPGSKYEALVDLFRMMDVKSDLREITSGPSSVKDSYFEKFADFTQSFGYALQDAAEYNVQTKIGMAVLIDTMIMNKATGDIISLYDAYEFDSNTKKAKLKNGYDTIVSLDIKNFDANGNPQILKETTFTDNFRYEIRNKIREINKQIHGNYAKDDRMVIQSLAIGRLAAQFHKWVAPAIKARFRREYFDENLGWIEGRYRSFWKFLAYSTKKIATLQIEFGKHDENFMKEYGYTGDNSQRDQKAKDKLFGAYRTLGEIGIIMTTFAISSILNAMFSDDDDETEFENRMENFLQYQADRTYKELILFTPLGSQQIYQMFDSPIAATRTLGEFGEALSLTVTTPIAYLIKSNEKFYLDSDYVYQRGIRKGELKVYKNWEDVIPILYSIKKYEDFNNLTNFYIK